MQNEECDYNPNDKHPKNLFVIKHHHEPSCILVNHRSHHSPNNRNWLEICLNVESTSRGISDVSLKDQESTVALAALLAIVLLAIAIGPCTYRKELNGIGNIISKKIPIITTI